MANVARACVQRSCDWRPQLGLLPGSVEDSVALGEGGAAGRREDWRRAMIRGDGGQRRGVGEHI